MLGSTLLKLSIKSKAKLFSGIAPSTLILFCSLTTVSKINEAVSVSDPATNIAMVPMVLSSE